MELEKEIQQRFDEDTKVQSDEYYEIGSALTINSKIYRISRMQFIYREGLQDFQTVVTVV